MFKTRKIAGILASIGLGVGLLGAGVYASYTDGATATVNARVGSLGCQVSASNNPNATISSDGHSVTVNYPDINSSTAGSDYATISVSNTGSIPENVYWTAVPTTGAGYVTYQPAGRVGYTTGANGNQLESQSSPRLLTTSLPTSSHSYDNVGFQWANLVNADEGLSAQVVYTAHCSEVPPPPPPPASNVQFISTGGTTGANGETLTLPSHQAGDTAVVMSYGAVGGHNPQTPAGYTSVSSGITAGSGGMTTLVSYRVLTPSDTTVSTTTGYGLLVGIYRNVAGIGVHTTQAITNTATLSCSALSLVKTDRSSQVLCMGGDSYGSSNAKNVAFPGTTNRTSGLTDGHVGFSDTNGGVSAWTTQTWLTNTPLPGSNPGVMWAIELESS